MCSLSLNGLYLTWFGRSSDNILIKLLSKDFEDRGRYKGVGNPVATTWLISFKHISRNPLAARYLRFMSFFAEKDIPRSLLPPADDELQVDEAIGVLKAYAFITQRKEQDLFDIHRLVHLVMRNWLRENGEQQEYASEVMQYVAKTFPFPKHENRDMWMKYLLHAQTVLDREACTKEPALLFNVGESFKLLGKYREAEQMYRQAFELRTEVHGREHPCTLGSMDNLALALRRLGRYDEAGQMHRQVFRLYTKLYGPEHPHTLAGMNSLALVLRRLGRYDEAEQMHRQAFELYTKVHGPEHFHTIISMSNLALVLKSLRRYDEAEQMHRQAFELYAKVHGLEHPHTITSMSKVASVLRSLKRYDEAEQMGRQAFELHMKVHGREHPHTLDSMADLALALRCLGQYNKAEQMHCQALELCAMVNGQENPDTIECMDRRA